MLFSRLLNLLPGEQVLGVVRAVGADPRVQRELACPPKDTAALQDLGLVVFQKVRSSRHVPALSYQQSQAIVRLRTRGACRQLGRRWRPAAQQPCAAAHSQACCFRANARVSGVGGSWANVTPPVMLLSVAWG